MLRWRVWRACTTTWTGGGLPGSRLPSQSPRHTAQPAGVNVRGGDRVRVGLRPCDIHVVVGAGQGRAGAARLTGKVILAERLGRNIELTVDMGGDQLIVLASGREGVDEGAEVSMTVADENVHLFAAGEGDTRRLSADDKTLEEGQ